MEMGPSVGGGPNVSPGSCMGWDNVAGRRFSIGGNTATVADDVAWVATTFTITGGFFTRGTNTAGAIVEKGSASGFTIGTITIAAATRH